jgi:tetratricopeptide (TPR) repeat protein
LIKAHSRVGQIEFLIGSPESARDAFSRAITTLDNHAGEAPTPAQQAERAELDTHLGGVYHALGNRPQALAVLRQAVSAGESLVAAYPSAADYRAGLAKSYGLLGVVHRTTGRRDLQSEAYRKALALLEQLHREDPSREAYRSSLASAYANIAVAHSDAGEDRAAFDFFQKASALLAGLVADHPEVIEHLSALVSVQQKQGIGHAKLGQMEEAEGTLERTLPLQQRLAVENPSVSEFQYDLAIAFQTLGTMRAQMRKWPEAEEALRGAIATQRKLVASQPRVREYAVFLSLTYATLAGIKKNSGTPESALEWYDQAIQELHGVLAHEAQNARAKDHLWWCHARRADTFDRLQRYDEAIKDWDQALVHADEKRRDALLAQRARSRAWIGDHLGAVSQVQPLFSKEQLSGEAHYHLAGVFAVSAEAAKKDTSLPENQRTTLAEVHVTRALEFLGRAHTAGHFAKPENAEALRSEPSLNSLRSHAEYKRLMQSLPPPR